MLHSLGADVNKLNIVNELKNDDTTPVQIAEHKGHTEVVELIRKLEV